MFSNVLDYAFGKCVPRGKETDSDFHQHKLNGSSLQLLKEELNRLLSLGYRWSHFYTQCVLKSLLNAFRYHIEYNENSCRVLSDDRSTLLYYDENPEQLDPNRVGQVQFTPSVVDPHAEFADEIYIPVLGKEDALTPLRRKNPLGKIQIALCHGVVDAKVKSFKPGMRSRGDQTYVDDLRQGLLHRKINNDKRARGKNGYEVFEADDADEETMSPDYFLNTYTNEVPDDSNLPNFNYLDAVNPKVQPSDDYESSNGYPSDSDTGNYDRDVDLTIVENIFANDGNILKSFSRNYNTPEKFRHGHETKDEVLYPKSSSYVRFDQPLEFYYPGERQFAYDSFGEEYRQEEGDRSKPVEDDHGVYTEGGVVYLKDDRTGDTDSFEEFMNAYSNLGFKRPERLDVKKPGPLITSSQTPSKTEKQENTKGSKTEKENEKSSVKAKDSSAENEVVAQLEKKKGGSPMESPTLRRQTTTVQPLKEKETNGNGLEYAYVVLKNRVNTWQEGSRIVRKMEDILSLRQNTFSNIRVEQNEIRFKVEPNRLNLNASEVVRRIDMIKDSIQRAIGVEVVSAGVGDQVSDFLLNPASRLCTCQKKTKYLPLTLINSALTCRLFFQSQLPTTMSLLGEDERQLWILSFLLCGIIAAIAIIGTVFFIVKRHPHARDKLRNLTQTDTEASKDYQETDELFVSVAQDLCRARMASKTAQDKPEGQVTGHRVTNLTRETEGANHSPSSRSSTSSWSEEPALTNMDISTGHMVLSYMEDHLKNKDRLEQEWIALCAYEAEPCATTVALKSENEKKNRYNDVLPYDHARVVLNELANVTGSDYINASTITDHDPRNPAYIASQGPLEQTTAHFWQMIWEQGSVVMVMLTRLTENGTTMCHRYWPEEGSELYHIYEVHLVSEHIWCDDYLVRSFYLKNIKTSETRTVTQFHFLSWPENGVPLSTKALLEFRRKVNKSYRGRSCPVVVHCSDGVGRTGTYCLIDMVLNRMAKGAKEIDIAATLEHIRDQRPLMVRTKQQFEFVLMAVAEEVHAILKALPANLNHSPPPVVKEKE
ncbi:hypothetical protein RUM43_014171 [Polyplax serrata]|uniref:Receptor-type tyrosine-protein phosphatase N2 n=1 Tax=Polyplax serrata TaxID=468196 RepID=A0AAN8NWV5_POLSC